MDMLVSSTDVNKHDIGKESAALKPLFLNIVQRLEHVKTEQRVRLCLLLVAACITLGLKASSNVLRL